MCSSDLEKNGVAQSRTRLKRLSSSSNIILTPKLRRGRRIKKEREREKERRNKQRSVRVTFAWGEHDVVSGERGSWVNREVETGTTKKGASGVSG